MVKKSKKQAEKLTAFGLLGSISYWGTAARLMFVGVFIAFAFLLNLTGDSSAQYIDSEIMFLIFGLTTLMVFDLGYVVAARNLPLNDMADRWMLMMGDLFISAFFVVPSLFQLSSDANMLRVVSLLVALFLVSVRILVGFLFSKRK